MAVLQARDKYVGIEESQKNLDGGTDDDETPLDTKWAALGRTTHEIDWRAIAENFEHVKLPSGNGGGQFQSPHASTVSVAGGSTSILKTIVSPFCRQIQDSPVVSDQESDSEEDLSDEAILARHQIVDKCENSQRFFDLESKEKGLGSG